MSQRNQKIEAVVGTDDDLEDRLLESRDRVRMSDGVGYLLSDMHRGVPVSWLAQVFGMDPATVKKRLKDCPPVHRLKAGYLYSVSQAAAYLIKPKFDVEEYIRTMPASELPVRLQREYWAAAKNRLDYELAAADLWFTDDVLDVFGDVFKHIKSTVQLWPEDVVRELKLDRAVKDALRERVDRLQQELYEKLVAMKGRKSKRGPVVDKIDSLLGTNDA